MYVRGAKNREEVWLLDRIEDLGLDDPAFRSRDYVVAVDEATGEKGGFGRIRVHTPDDSDPACELTTVGVLPDWRGQGVGAHVVERLVEHARDQGFEGMYSLTPTGGYLAQFGFERVREATLPPKLRERLAEVREREAREAKPFHIAVADFRMPPRLRNRFKRAGDGVQEDEGESPEDFGIDTDSATYKYDTGR
jgi:N-acetylglutamate synthase-like GNAT family acetyltransferase